MTHNEIIELANKCGVPALNFYNSEGTSYHTEFDFEISQLSAFADAVIAAERQRIRDAIDGEKS